MATVGFIRDARSWQDLLTWARSQNFDDYAVSPQSVPFRVENILKNDAQLKTWDGTQMQFAKGWLACHYHKKQSKSEPTPQELIERGQTVLPLEDTTIKEIPF